MSDQEVPGGGSSPGHGGHRFDAVERLRKKLEAMKAAEAGSPGTGERPPQATRLPRRPRRMSEETAEEPAEDDTSTVTRLPRRPRRMSEEASEHSQKTWRSEGDSVFDAAPPTRPVLRAELQQETGTWHIGPAWYSGPDADSPAVEQEGSVLDFGAARRKKAGDEAHGVGLRRVAKPRRIGKGSDEGPDTEGVGDGDPE